MVIFIFGAQRSFLTRTAARIKDGLTRPFRMTIITAIIIISVK